MPDLVWRLHLASSPDRVYWFLATDEGRAAFWAESAVEGDGTIEFVFPDGTTWEGRILERNEPSRFALRYLGGSLTTFDLRADEAGGTDLTLTDAEITEADIDQTKPGWVSVLLALKATADFGIDLRNHDRARTWDRGYVDN